MINDEGFDLPSEKALRARLCAEKLLLWMTNKKEAAITFSDKLCSDLRTCILHQHNVKFRTLRQRMWENYYKLCSSDDFIDSWALLHRNSIGLDPCPVFYQFVTKVIMEALIKQVFPKPVSAEHQKKDVSPLEYEELNALRYTAGYILRSLIKKLDKSAHPLKQELILCIKELNEKIGTYMLCLVSVILTKFFDCTIASDANYTNHCNISNFIGIDDDSSSDLSATEDWTNLVDRGSLIHVNDITFMVFTSMELEVRKHLKTTSTGMKEMILEELLKNEDVLFYWSLVSVDWGEESAELLKLIAQQWITIRGFSFVSGFMELYKQNKKKTLQKSKSLRKKLL